MRGTWFVAAQAQRSMGPGAAFLDQWTFDPTCLPGNTVANMYVRLFHIVDYTSGAGSALTFKLYEGGTSATIDGTLRLTETGTGPTSAGTSTVVLGTLTSIPRPSATTIYKLVGQTSGATLPMRTSQLLISPVYIA